MSAKVVKLSDKKKIKEDTTQFINEMYDNQDKIGSLLIAYEIDGVVNWQVEKLTNLRLLGMLEVIKSKIFNNVVHEDFLDE